MHERVVTKRKRIFLKLSDSSFKEELFSKRIKTNMWSIDEIFRHTIASEVFYIHSKFGVEKMPIEWGVGAQWVGESKFGLKEGIHFSLNLSMNSMVLSSTCLDNSITSFNEK